MAVFHGQKRRVEGLHRGLSGFRAGTKASDFRLEFFNLGMTLHPLGHGPKGRA